MGRHFGDLAVIRGIIYYRLSPHELKPFATAFAHGIPNLIPRTLATMYTWLPSTLILIRILFCCSFTHKVSVRKDFFF